MTQRLGYQRIFRSINDYTSASGFDFQGASESADGGVPQVVYQTWLENGFGWRHRLSLRGFMRRNPNFQFVFFDDREIEEFMEREFGAHPIYPVFCGAQFGPFRTDVFRYCLLYRYGGAWFDIKCAVDTPLSGLVDFSVPNALVSFEFGEMSEEDRAQWKGRKLLSEPDRIAEQWGLAFSPGHPILKRVIELLIEDYPRIRGVEMENPREAIIDRSGPRQYTRALWDVLEGDEDVPITDLGLALHGYANFQIPGSTLRFLQVPHYSSASHEPIVV